MEVNLEKKVREARYQRTKVILLIGHPATIRFPDPETAALQALGWEKGFLCLLSV